MRKTNTNVQLLQLGTSGQALRSSQFPDDEQLHVVHDRLQMLVHLASILADVASQVHRIRLTCLCAQMHCLNC